MSAPAPRDWRLPKGNKGYSNSRCKRCGSWKVAWVERISTGRVYLAFASPIVGSLGSKRVHGDTRHDCKDPAAGGFPACLTCGRHHHVNPQAPQGNCPRFPNAPR